MTLPKPGAVTSHSPNALAAVEQEIARACKDANRDRASVTLIAVSKTFDAGAISAGDRKRTDAYSAKTACRKPKASGRR